MKIEPIGDEEDYLNLLVYGDPGAGKTTFAASAAKHPDLGPVLVINVEGGMLSIRTTPGVHATEQIKSTGQVEKLFWRLCDPEDLGKYKTVIIDSVTELQTLNLEEIAGKSGRGPDSLELQDYGRSTAQLKHLFRMFRDLPKHVIFTALVRREYPEKAKMTAQPTDVRPALTGKLCQSTMGYMDAVWYMYVDSEGDHKIITSPVGVYKAKTRGARFSAALGGKIENNDLAEVYSTFKQTEGKQQ